MSSFKVFDIAGSGMSAQTVRLNLVASNLSNVDSVASSMDKTYRSRQPVFAAQLENVMNQRGQTGQTDKSNKAVGVDVLAVVESQAPLQMEYNPDHPLANADGYIYKSNVNPIEEMANMLSASRSYQDNAEVINTAKQLMQQTLRLGQG